MKSSKDFIKHILITGFAMFAMFFGAGNLIFPPALGLLSGSEWLIAFIGFFIMDAGLATIAVFAMLNYNGDINQVGQTLGKTISILLAIVVILCIGPCVAIPRTAAVTFSMGLVPLLGLDPANKMALAIFSIVFFIIVFILAIKPTKVIDIIGKYLTPILLVCLLFMIVIGLISSNASPAEVISDNPVKEGVLNGYQTMDAMASLLFAGILIKVTYVNQGNSAEESNKIIALASIISCSLLFIVYGGLTFLGASWGQPFTQELLSGNIDNAGLLISILDCILGKSGVVVIAVITLFACLTTAVGLTSSISEYFEELVNHKVPYGVFVLLICLCGALLCNIGLNQIISLASPILSLIYPPITVLIFLGLFKTKIHGRITFIIGSATAFAVSLFTVMNDTLGLTAFSFIHKLPLSSYGLNFIVPSAIGVAIGLILSFIHKKNSD